MKNSGNPVGAPGTLCIASTALPGALFDSTASLREFGGERVTYDHVVAAYEQTGDAADLCEGLQALGYEKDEIKRHRENPGWRDLSLFAGAE